MQKDHARLHEVLHSIGWIVKVLQDFPDQDFRDTMLVRIDKRWKDWEQPLLILSFILHPNYRFNKFNPQSPNLSYPNLGQWLLYYYCAWFNEKPSHLLLELELFRQGDYPFDDDTFKQFQSDILLYWQFLSTHTIDLHKIALRIYSICVNSASCERLFSSMGFLHSKRRNRLKVKCLKCITLL